ncbi:MAG: S41 family peptidase [Verrucomicrobiota bacterium]
MKPALQLLICVAGAFFSPALRAAEPVAVAPAVTVAPDFQEVYSLVRSNIASLSTTEVDRLALDGLLTQLDGKVTLVQAESHEAVPTEPSVAAARLYDDAFGYVRLSRVETGVAEEFAKVVDQLQSTNQLKGLVLDLRFARGQDYTAAATIADYFFSANKPLFQLAGVMMRSTAKEKPFPHPVAILVNSQTRGAAEAIAAVLRHNKVGLVIGQPSAGQAVSYREYPLSNGQKLRIATGSVRLGAELTLMHKGVEPDIKVQVSQTEERAYLADAYKIFPHETNAAASPDATASVASESSTSAARRLTNEAELVRRHKESLGESADPASTTATPAEPEVAKPQVRDPALVRALDLLKGLALIKTVRPS